MRKTIFYIISIPILFLACKKDKDTPEYKGTILLDINNYGLEFALKKVHQLTDSIYLEFTTVALYDCNKYTINMAVQSTEKELNITLGNIYKYDPFCILGQFPAIGKYKTKALSIGNYLLKVKKGSSVYEGTLTVSPTAYTIQWEHDTEGMQIDPKILIK